MDLNNRNGLISIIIPTYNRADFLAEISVPSVIKQNNRKWELLIIDDGSVDDTKKIAESFLKEDRRIRYFYKENGGQGSARNFGLKKSLGDYVLFLDSDDALLPTSLDFFYKYINSCAVDILFSWRFIFSKKTNNFKIIGVGGPSPSSVLYKKSFCESHPYSEDRNLIGLEDAELTLRIENDIFGGSNVKMMHADTPTVLYMDHPQQITNDNTPRLLVKMEKLVSFVNTLENVEKSSVCKKIIHLGHLCALTGDIKVAREHFLKSFVYKKTVAGVFLYSLTFLGKGFYKISMTMLKNTKDFIVMKVLLLYVFIKHTPRFFESRAFLGTLTK